MTTQEPLLNPKNKRMALHPIKFDQIWSMYLKSRAAFWIPGEVDLSADLKDWVERLNNDERYFLSMVLAFFSIADSVVATNLGERFAQEVQPNEATYFYDFQKSMENIHAEMYSILVETYIQTEEERDKLRNAAQNFPCVKKKIDWAEQWITSSESFAMRLVAFAVVEGVFFSGSFCAIFWLKARNLMPGLSHANQLIARDEGMHQEFAVLLYGMLTDKLDDRVVQDLVRSAVDVEVEFCTEACKVDLIGMNGRDMTQYIQYVADRLLTQLGVPPLYNTTNPFPFMELISLQGKTNFFERRVSEYQKAGVVATGDFTTEADF